MVRQVQIYRGMQGASAKLGTENAAALGIVPPGHTNLSD